MKTVIRKSKNSGSVLMISLILSAVFGITLASYLVLVDHQTRSVHRSQIWNSAMVVAEAGIEDALELLNKHAGSPDDLKKWITTCTSDGWTLGSNHVYSLKRNVDATKETYYVVSIINTNENAPVILSTGYVPGPSWISGSPPVSRTIMVRTRLDTLFNVCMAALGTIDMKGNNVKTDSYISSDTNWSSNGLYPENEPSKRRAGGDVATNATLTNSVLNVANADIAGKVLTGPEGSVTIGPNGTVGDIPWVTSQKGIMPGWYQNDMNVVFKDVVLPNVPWIPAGGIGTGAPGSVIVKGSAKSFDHVFTVSGNYSIPANKSIYVGTNVSVQLHVTASTFSPSAIYVAGTGTEAGKMVAYMAGSTATLGTEHKTQSGKPANLEFFGLPSCTSLSYKGNGDFSGVIYAPQAHFQLAGGGSGSIDFTGASVTKTIQMNGHYEFHYDEDLKNNGPSRGFIGQSWKEL